MPRSPTSGGFMRYRVGTGILLFISVAVFSQGVPSQPLAFPLACSGHDCSLLSAAPQTSGMRSGFVRLKPGESVGAHSTNENEESLVILRGHGKAEVEGHPTLQLSPEMLAYIPPHLRHNVTNTGTELLEYVYVVAPIRQR